MTKPSPAAEVLLGSLSQGRALSAVSRQPTTDWNEVFEVATREHVAPLLFKRLKESDARACVPADAWKRLRRAYFTSGDRSTRLYRELGAVLRSLGSSGVRVIVLKGAFLAEAVYGDVALRPMCDNDLLVQRAELARAEAVLLDMGGVHRKQRGAETEPDRGKTKHALPVFFRDLVVELHWTIANPAGPVRVDAAGLWDRARPATIAGVEVLSLSPEDLLLHLCLHFCYQHGCVGPRGLCDIAETVHRFRGEMDWTRVAQLAREWGAARYVGLAVHLARSTLAAEVPDDVLERLVPGGLDLRLLGKARECVLDGEPYSGWAVLPFSNRWGDKSAWEKVKALRDVVFLSRNEMALRYPRARDSQHLWSYYILRSLDLLRTYGSATLGQGLRMMRVRERDDAPSLADWLKSGKP